MLVLHRAKTLTKKKKITPPPSCNGLIYEDQEEEEEADLFAHEVDTINARTHTKTVDMFKLVLLFSQGALEALYDSQMITRLDIL